MPIPPPTPVGKTQALCVKLHWGMGIGGMLLALAAGLQVKAVFSMLGTFKEVGSNHVGDPEGLSQAIGSTMGWALTATLITIPGAALLIGCAIARIIIALEARKA